MSQVFAADGVMSTATVTIVPTTATLLVTGNYVNPPFGNAKALVSAIVGITPGTGSTFVNVRLVRNPNGENTTVAGPLSITAAAGAPAMLAIQGPDAIPDGRPVQYGVSITQQGASTNGTVNYASVTTLLISG